MKPELKEECEMCREARIIEGIVPCEEGKKCFIKEGKIFNSQVKKDKNLMGNLSGDTNFENGSNNHLKDSQRDNQPDVNNKTNLEKHDEKEYNELIKSINKQNE